MDNHYRVNVQTGADAVSVRIADSFFIEADEEREHHRVGSGARTTVLRSVILRGLTDDESSHPLIASQTSSWRLQSK